MKPGYDEGITQWLMPLGMKVTTVVKSGQAKIYVIQQPAGQSP